jgi:large subunit ribosomal protein L30
MVRKKKKANSLRIQYFRSAVGRPKGQKKIVQGLGFRRLNQVLERPDTPEIRGMVNKVNHLVRVVEGEES